MHQRNLGVLLATVARLTPAQQALLSQISQHSSPVTISDLADELGLHVSSVRETIEALHESGLVTRERMPIQGRGRPSLGYATYLPTDPSFAGQMFTQAMQATFSWIRDSQENPENSAYDLGKRWGEQALFHAGIPDHSAYSQHQGVIPSSHIDKIRLFFTAMGYGAAPDGDSTSSLILTACPYIDPTHPDPLALETRRGFVEGVLEVTAHGAMTATVEPIDGDPVRARLVLITPPRGDSSQITVKFYGGAAAAAGAEVLRLPALPSGATLNDLLASLGGERPQLREIFGLSKFLIDDEPATRETTLDGVITVEVLPPFAGG